MEIDPLYQHYRVSGRVSTDTREITPGSVFFALRGPRFNANAFAEEAIEKGAHYAVIDDPAYAKDDRYIVVADTLATLQMLARHHRHQLNIPVIGLTGSNGKTTTKELLQAVLSTRFRTLSTPGNLNNHIGVPLTVLSIDTSVEVAVIEMGANHIGEIAALCAIADPTFGLITNIGRAHIGTFGGAENILRAKSELYQYLIEHSGTVFINSQNPVLSTMAKRFQHPVFYPAPGDFYSCRFVDADPYVSLVAENGETIATHLTGTYNSENIAAALCVGKYFGVEARLANAAVARYTPGNMRSQILLKDTNRIILDAYNANPSSMEAAIDNLAKMNAVSKVAILGDMYELGEETEAEHRKVGSMLKQKGIAEVFLCGPHMLAALETCPYAVHTATRDELEQRLRQTPVRNATILVKASRGMGLEKIVDVL
jgi:UDP-N-acetylmuramoyl-tripeptide--D-alanyl-D-alanine ligase